MWRRRRLLRRRGLPRCAVCWRLLSLGSSVYTEQRLVLAMCISHWLL